MKTPNKQIGNVTLRWNYTKAALLPLAAIKVHVSSRTSKRYKPAIRIMVSRDERKQGLIISTEYDFYREVGRPFNTKEQYQLLKLSSSLPIKLELFYTNGDMYVNIYRTTANEPREKILDNYLFLNKMELAMIEYLSEKRKTR